MRPVSAVAVTIAMMNVPSWRERVEPQRSATSGGSMSAATMPAATASSKSWQT